jgi:omega-6 fatty acid desaturase (delta-12 desaturase)
MTSVRELRARLAPYRHSSLVRALLHVVVSTAVWLAAFRGAVAGTSVPWRLACGLVAGLFSGNLFMIGHDACHGSTTRHPLLNQVLGRLAFLPSYHPYSVWDYSHNRTHHIYTNLKDRDFVWAPLSKAEYDALPRLRRLLYRVYRTPLGMALYYPLELWRERLFFPRREHIDRPRRTYVLDNLLVALFMLAQAAAILGLGGASAPGLPPWGGWLSAAFFGVVVPWLVFGWLIGFVVYFNHTHPAVVWYADRSEWSFREATLLGTVHLRFPRWTRFFASNIMAHVAHHLDPRIPLVQLSAAEERLEQLVPEIVVEAWSVRELRRIQRVCRLYDFEARRWLDYDGTPTTSSAARPAVPPGDGRLAA